MSNLAPVDILEEDAADLQFPKDVDIIEINPSEQTHRTVQHYKYSNPNENNIFSQICNGCANSMVEPYICCAECSELFCLQCFSTGKETTKHVNSHFYTIRNDLIKIFPTSNWSAREEKKLLDSFTVHGFGNWEDISKSMQPRSPEECREHYLKYYFGGIFEKTIGLTDEPYEPIIVPFLYKMKSIDPPRPELDSVNFKTMAGYRSARGDFDTPYDNSAESIVSNLDLKNWSHDDQDVGDALNCAMFTAYNNRLRERRRRYRIMREHGLLVTSRTLSWLSKHMDALGCEHNNGRLGGTGRFISTMQLTTAIAFDALVESMQYAHSLKKYIFRLNELRKNGITTFHSGRLYYKLRAKRLTKIKDKKAEQYENQWDWKLLVPNTTNGQNASLSSHQLFVANPSIKRKSTPLDILGLPLYDKLTDDEKQLCSRIRLVPSAYLCYKNILIAENAKVGYLRLADARKLIKIDVNKTRQLYDFLLKGGFVDKPFA